MRCDNWSLMYPSSLSHDTISAALFQGENTLRQSSPEAFLMHHHFEVTEMTLWEALWSEVKLSLISDPANDLLRGKKKKKEGGGGAKGRRRIEKDKHIPCTYSLHYEWGGGGRSFNYWLPSQANIPACQGPFWLSFGQSSSDGPHFLLNRTRRRCENGDTWSCVRDIGNALARPRACQQTPSTPSSAWTPCGWEANKVDSTGRRLNQHGSAAALMCIMCSTFCSERKMCQAILNEETLGHNSKEAELLFNFLSHSISLWSPHTHHFIWQIRLN